jgi:bifunctional ADP-heptose synthase (sugar kinase/adenylyltransferase)
MTSARFSEIAGKYAALRIAVVGDFCLDRYLEIDPGKAEVSLETGLPVHNVVNVRAQPGGAGTIVNNLAALGVGTILPVGLVGDDGEGYELSSAMKGLPGCD